jgi:hypothetical protein
LKSIVGILYNATLYQSSFFNKDLNYTKYFQIVRFSIRNLFVKREVVIITRFLQLVVIVIEEIIEPLILLFSKTLLILFRSNKAEKELAWSRVRISWFEILVFLIDLLLFTIVELPWLPEVATEAKVGLSEVITTGLAKLTFDLADLTELEIRIVIS